MENKNKFWLPYAAIIGIAVYAIFWILLVVKNPAYFLYDFKSFVVFFICLVLTWVFYSMVVNQPGWVNQRGITIKTYLQIFPLFIIFYIPLAWYSFASPGWFSGVGAILYAVIGIPVLLIVGGIFSFILKKQEVSQPSSAVSGAIVILCLISLCFFIISLYSYMRPLNKYQKAEKVLIQRKVVK
ncbi:MAG: hypothetical protein HY918_03530 [Candidatus Doudnabacteria bacterium]|nr:hypothetical protein [Candidatus Doudnabacteria bacterium]